MKIVNKTGYLKGAKTAKNPVNIIPSNLITTQGMAFPIKANGKTLYPNTGQYKFPTSPVVETPLKQDGVKGAKAGPTIENAKKLKSKEGTQIFSTPALGVQKEGIIKFANNPSNKFNPRKVKSKRATGAVNMTMSPVDVGIAAAAGIPALAGRTLTSVLPKIAGALNTPLTTAVPGVTAGNIISSGFAADAMVNRLPQVPGQIKRKEYGAAAENVLTGGLDLLGAGMLKSSPIKFGSKSKIKYGVNPSTNVVNKTEANAVIKPKINFEELKKSIKKDFSPDDFTNSVTERFTYRDPHTNEVVYKLDPEDYNNFTNPDDIKLAKGHFDEYVNKYNADIARGQEEVVDKVKRLLIPKQKLLDKDFFYTNDQIKQRVKNNKDYEKLQKEINDIDPNILTEEDIDKLLVSRPDLQKRYYDIMDEGMDFKDNMLTPSQEKYVRKNLESHVHNLDFRNMLSKKNLEDFQKGLIKQPLTSKQIERYMQQGIDAKNPFYGYTGGYTKEGIHPSPENLKKVKFPIRFGPGSMNKQGNKNIKSNLVKYKDGSKSVSLAFSRGEKDPKGGLTQKGVDKYNRATGGNLKMAVTTPPSKLKAGSKAANRRKSFCARMSGVKGPMAKNGKPTRKALALRKWNC